MTALLAGGLSGCGEARDARTGEVASVLARADMPLIRTRPELVAGKYAVMAEDAYSFFRGTVPLALHDWQANRDGAAESAFGADEPLVLSLGDAHIENFGTLRAEDGTFGLEPNDFDSADRGPYLWDVRRLVAAAALAARLSNDDDETAHDAASAAARDIAFAAARSYAETMASLAEGAPRHRSSEPGTSPVLTDLFERSAKGTDTRSELVDLTTTASGSRLLRRGIVDPTDPRSQLKDLPEACLHALPAALSAYRATLIAPPPPSFFQIEDAARELGSGVASFPRVRVLVLVRGPTASPDDDVILEIKEIGDALGLGHAPPDVSFDSLQSRVLHTTRSAWATPSAAPLWGTSEMLGFPVQVRLRSGGQKTLRVSRLHGKRGTPEALTDFAAHLGALLARVHASPVFEGDPSPAPDVVAAIGGDSGAFAAEQADLGVAAAERVLADHQRFRAALADLGPTLGVVPDEADAPSPELAALYSGLPAPER